MNWISLSTTSAFKGIQSAQGFCVIFKHSTRCSVSSMAKRSFEYSWNELANNTIDVPCYYLDLIAHRELSNLVAETYQVEHQSPQILLIRDNICVLDRSHEAISAEEILDLIKK